MESPFTHDALHTIVNSPYTPYATAAALVVPTVVIAKRVMHRYMMRTYTGVPDLEALGTQAKPKGNVAVVCGGSIAGLLTARVLSDHFDRVVVIEPEAWALSNEAADGVTTTGTCTVAAEGGSYATLTHKRTRVYQYTAMHAYQVLLGRVLRKLFPGFDELARGRGVIFAPAEMNARLSGWGCRLPYAEYGGTLPEVPFTSRRTLEGVIRGCVRAANADGKIEFVHGTVTDFKLSSDATRLTAVTMRDGAGSTRIVTADLVVDCTGVIQGGLKMLTRTLNGNPKASSTLATLRQSYDPKIDHVTIEVPYPANFEENIAKIKLDTGVTGKWAGPKYLDTTKVAWWYTLAPDPDVDYRILAAGRKDNGIVFFAGGWTSEMPVTLEQMREYAQGVKSDNPVPQFYFDILDLCMPVADRVTVFEGKVNSCSRVFYERAADVLPRNFVAVGDATMRLNPRFGEGVTKAALGATTLDGVLRSYAPSHKAFGATYFQRLANRTQSLWDGSKWSDYGRETTTPCEGETLEEGKFFRWFKLRLNRVLERDDAAGSAMFHAQHYLAPMQYAMTPRIMLKVLWEGMFPTAPFERRA
ncbi:hypothetical protein EXIGLDRAFT_751119 [Exidia glandulosa HHB12029]|uniref:FAD/NAD(P)-binding domain-containing protein n=1 Tax=Exidia glandulosa HHB12029 TaxID=1314781 RepID=A0A165FUM6_EXIGL|nr:hypothetical protein EXIGLDRAFT_751119 [Exidia glandulosa HHB12029]